MYFKGGVFSINENYLLIDLNVLFTDNLILIGRQYKRTSNTCTLG